MARKLVCDANSTHGALTAIVLSMAHVKLRLLESDI